MSALDDYIRNGYFPKELPYAFSTESLADLYKTGFEPEIKPIPTYPTIHRYAKYGNVQRKLGIVHPQAFLGLSKEITSHYERIQKLLHQSPLSKTASVIPSQNSEDRLLDQLRIRTNKKFLLQADISNLRFYIYPFNCMGS